MSIFEQGLKVIVQGISPVAVSTPHARSEPAINGRRERSQAGTVTHQAKDSSDIELVCSVP